MILLFVEALKEAIFLEIEEAIDLTPIVMNVLLFQIYRMCHSVQDIGADGRVY
jgi:hypothetical protein|tara:strand:+ start:1372 stop:1530 length:159 start_codon:yes stop_codon:yes gene_type:complete